MEEDSFKGTIQVFRRSCQISARSLKNTTYRRKFAAGPTCTGPGPMLLYVATAVNVVTEIFALYSDKKHRNNKDSQVGDSVDIYRADDIVFYTFAVHFYFFNTLRMYIGVCLFQEGLERDYDS